MSEMGLMLLMISFGTPFNWTQKSEQGEGAESYPHTSIVAACEVKLPVIWL